MTWPKAEWTRESRVQACIEIMSAGNWKRGHTSRELAAKWGITVTTMKAISGEAWRRIQSRVLDKGRIQVEAVLKLEEVAAEARALTGTVSERAAAAERANAIRAYESLLRFASGADQGTISVDWHELSPEEKWRRIDDARARIEAIASALPPRVMQFEAPEAAPVTAGGAGEEQ